MSKPVYNIAQMFLRISKRGTVASKPDSHMKSKSLASQDYSYGIVFKMFVGQKYDGRNWCSILNFFALVCFIFAPQSLVTSY